MSRNTQRAGVVGTAACAIASALTLVMAGPAWAGSQWPNCYHFQVGWTKWQQSQDYDTITPFNGIWENRNGDLVASETQYLKAQSGLKFRIYGEGDSHWALAGILVEADTVAGKGAWCDGPDASVTNVVAGPLYDNLPLDTLNAAPPLPKLEFVVEVEDIAS